jgi:hypothetical protein
MLGHLGMIPLTNRRPSEVAPLLGGGDVQVMIVVI